MSVVVHGEGESESDFVVRDFMIGTSDGGGELSRLERDVTVSGEALMTSPASALFPGYSARFAFSPRWRHVLFVVFPRELVVFDLQYETKLFSAALPRGCAKFVDVLVDLDNEWIYCRHFQSGLHSRLPNPSQLPHLQSQVTS